MNRYFKSQTNEITNKMTWERATKGKSKERNLISTNHTKNNTERTSNNKTQQNSICRLCGERDEIIIPM